MRFALTEIELRLVMAVGDAITKLDRVGRLPPKLTAILQKSLKELRPSRACPDPIPMLGVAKLEDGRVYWTLTGFGLSKKKAPIRRTSVYSFEGHQMFNSGQNAAGTMHHDRTSGDQADQVCYDLLGCSSPTPGMDLIRIARRVGEKTKKPKKPSKTSLKKKPGLPIIPEAGRSVLSPGVEYSFKVDLSFTVDFEGAGDVSEIRVRNKLKSEIAAAIKGAVLMTADDFQLQASNISVQPVRVEAALNDQMPAVELDDR